MMTLKNKSYSLDVYASVCMISATLSAGSIQKATCDYVVVKSAMESDQLRSATYVEAACLLYPLPPLPGPALS